MQKLIEYKPSCSLGKDEVAINLAKYFENYIRKIRSSRMHTILVQPKACRVAESMSSVGFSLSKRLTTAFDEVNK